MSRLAVWGAGDMAHLFLNSINLDENEITLIVDSNSSIEGTNFYGYGVVNSPNILDTVNYDMLVICMKSYMDVLRICQNKGFYNIRIFDGFENIKIKFNYLLKPEFKELSEDELYRRASFLAIRQIISPVIKKYKDIDHCSFETLVERNERIRYVWSFWWQDDSVEKPLLVSKCFNKMHEIFDDSCVFTILNKDNYSKYIDIPDYIIEKVDKGIIRLNELSTIVRTKLLKKYGGIWFDATIYIPHNISEDFWKYHFFSVKETNVYDDKKTILPHAYMSAVLSVSQNNFLMNFTDEAVLQYWERKNTLINFHLYSYIIRIAYEEFECVKKQIDVYPYNNIELETLNIIMNEKYNYDKWVELCKVNSLFKLSNRKEYLENTTEGEMTYWGAFKCDLI